MAMDLYWKGIVASLGEDPRTKKARSPGRFGDIALVTSPQNDGEGATETVGRLAYRAVTGRSPRAASTRKTLSTAVHWTYGGLQGALFGVLRGGRVRSPDVVGGAAFGTLLWGVSEVVLPMLGLGSGPTAYPAEHHTSSWGAHAVYGATASAVAQALAD